MQRITRNEDGRKVKTPALIYTFSKTTYPLYMKVCLLRVATCPYIPNPQRYVNCSQNFHGEECGETLLCRNCKGDHQSTNRQSAVYKREVEVITVKVSKFPRGNKLVATPKW